MKIFKKITFFIIACLLLAACKKESLPPSSATNQPVFSFDGNIGGTPISWHAGINNYYMYSSYAQNQGVYSFTGTLQNTGTRNNSIQIIIDDDVIKPSNAVSDIANSVAMANIYYYTTPGGTSIEDSVEFIPKIGYGAPTSFSYTFGDGASFTGQNNAPVWHVYKTFQNYNTELGVVFNGYGLDTLSNPVYLERQLKNIPLIDSVSAAVVKDTANPPKYTVTFTPYMSGGTPPYSYTWIFGDGSLHSHLDTTKHQYPSTTATYTPTLQVTDSKGAIAAPYNYRIAETKDTSSHYSMNFAISKVIHVPNPYSLSTVMVNYTDSKGIIYTSNNSSQPWASAFQITSISDYQSNSSNNTTKMLKISFNCMLYNAEQNDSIQATNCTAVIAVAYH